jgi:predicted membrane protein
MDFGWIFIDFLPQHGMAEIAKIVDSSMFFYRFLIFWLLGFWIDFGIVFSSIFDPKINQKPIKNQSQNRSKSPIAKISKIYKKT